MTRNFISFGIIFAGISAIVLAGCSNQNQTPPVSQLAATSQALATHKTERVLYSFKKKSDGAEPLSGLLLDKQGNVYGTTAIGGTAGNGTVFILSSSSTGYAERILHNFSAAPDGSFPRGTLSLDSKGTLYGTTQMGGKGYGTVFGLKPFGSGYTESILHSFDPFFYASDGEQPYAGVTVDSNGVLYGTASTGGYGGQGTIFILRPSGSGYDLGGWGFGLENNGVGPYGGVLIQKDGFLYGTTSRGGDGDAGTVFQVKVSGMKFPKVIHAFTGSDGASPQSALVLGKNGAIYGTTVDGGAANIGTVFRLARHNHTWTETVLYSFTGSTDGALPHGAPLISTQGVIYGTAAAGGSDGNGVVYALTPSGTGFTERTVYSFKGKPDGATPMSELIFGKKGELLGTTESGGKANRGSIFAIDP
jgi:uncharacterized repeat protein (TIGR03803 family)